MAVDMKGLGKMIYVMARGFISSLLVKFMKVIGFMGRKMEELKKVIVIKKVMRGNGNRIIDRDMVHTKYPFFSLQKFILSPAGKVKNTLFLGTYRWSDGRVYVGEWDKGKKHGSGNIFFYIIDYFKFILSEVSSNLLVVLELRIINFKKVNFEIL